MQLDVDASGADRDDGARGAAGARAAHVRARVDAYVLASGDYADEAVFYWMSGKQRPAEDSEWASSSLLGACAEQVLRAVRLSNALDWLLGPS